MTIFTNPPTAEDLALWITGTYTVLDLFLTKTERLLDHALRIRKKLQKFRESSGIRSAAAGSERGDARIAPRLPKASTPQPRQGRLIMARHGSEASEAN